MEKKTLPHDWYLLEAWGGMILTAKVEVTPRAEFYLPLTWVRAKVDGRDQPFAKPRLPGNYAFVRLQRDPENPNLLNEQAAVVAGLRGVRAIFKNAAGFYSVVPKAEIMGLREVEAEEHRDSGKARSKVVPFRFKPGTRVRILRSANWEGQVGEFLYTLRGMATVAMGDHIKVQIPECDLVEASGTERKAG